MNFSNSAPVWNHHSVVSTGTLGLVIHANKFYERAEQDHGVRILGFSNSFMSTMIGSRKDINRNRRQSIANPSPKDTLVCQPQQIRSWILLGVLDSILFIHLYNPSQSGHFWHPEVIPEPPKIIDGVIFLQAKEPQKRPQKHQKVKRKSSRPRRRSHAKSRRSSDRQKSSGGSKAFSQFHKHTS